MTISTTTMLDEMIRRLEQERQRNPGGDLLAAQEIVVEVALEHTNRERDVTRLRKLEVAITASRLLDAKGGVR